MDRRTMASPPGARTRAARIGLIVDEVELARALEDMSDVEHLPRLASTVSLGIRRRADPSERA